MKDIHLLPKIPVIYSITNIINGKRYIGSTNDARQRAYDHQAMLRKGKHHSIILQNSCDKYGEENLIFEIFCSIIDIGSKYQIEQLILDELQPEYNCKKIVTGLVGYKHSEESKKKMREKRANRIITDETREKIRKAMLGKKMNFSQEVRERARERMKQIRISSLLPNGFPKNSKKIKCNETGEIFCSIRDASRKLGIPRTGIWKCVSGHKEKTHNLSFSCLD